MKHSTITIEEVENGFLINIVDDATRKSKKVKAEGVYGDQQVDVNELMAALKPRIIIAATPEEACKIITDYFKSRGV